MRHVFYTAMCAVFILILVSCSSAGTETPVATPPVDVSAVSTAPSQATPTFTVIPSPTSAPQRALLYAPPGSDPSTVSQLEGALQELAAQEGYLLELRSELQESDLEPDVKIVIVLPPDPGLAAWADSHPEIQFLALGLPDLQPAPNLSVIGSQDDRPDQQGFLAGYLAAVITPDWRVGVLSPAGSTPGRAAQRGFGNGVVFFCGLCRPAYPPFIQYPVYAELPAGASQADQQAAVDTLVANGVKTVYVAPGTGDETLLEYLAQSGINIIGNTSPPAALADNWVATISVDLPAAIRQVWPDLIGEQSGASLSLPLAITNQNPNLFSPGRQQLVENLQADLLSGYIDTGVDPLTGEPK